MTNNKPIKAVRIALDMVEILVEEGGTKPSVVASRMDMPRSTVHDYLRTLTEEGYAINVDGEYQPALRFLYLGGRIRSQNRLFQIARPKLKELAKDTNEHASLIVEENGLSVVLYTAVGPEMEAAVVNDGTPAYLHATAAGKVILASHSDEWIDDIIERHGLKQITDNTIDDKDKLFDEIELVREQGYGTDQGEALKGMRGVAAPIQAEDGSVVGAVSLYGPMKQNEISSLVDNLLKTVNIIEVDLTYQ